MTKMTISLFDYQKKAISELKTGSILWGGVGSGKTLTALMYYREVECSGTPSKDLYVITTARKRDELDWEKEAVHVPISKDPKGSVKGVTLTVDSWNNIGKYVKVKNAFFIFDEQRVVGSGVWVKSFLKVAKNNNWILLSATPGDTWTDYIPVFVANGFYKNRTEFLREHVVYNTFANYPKIDRYVNEGRLEKYRRQVLVKMDYEKKTKNIVTELVCGFNEYNYSRIFHDRWNPYKNRPIKDAGEYYYTMRRLVNSDPSRLETVLRLQQMHKKLIVFYNFDYELDILRTLSDRLDIPVAEYNGHLHEDVPQGDEWIYIAQYLAAGEAWECTTTNAEVLYSRNYSYKQTIQAMGRIDRQNTPYENLFYYFLTSDSEVDREIRKSYGKKKNFNEARTYKKRLASET